MAWSRISQDGPVLNGPSDREMRSVTLGRSGLVVVGWEASDDDSDAAVWISPDGVTWSRVAHDEEVFGGEGGQQMLGVVAGGPGLVAVGFDESGGDADAAVWTSRDGAVWSRVPHQEAVFGGVGDQSMFGVTTGGPGLVAVGGNHLENLSFGQDGEGAVGAVWTSPDGVTRSRVAHDDAVFGGEANQTMWSVAAGGPGLIAVGVEESDDFDAAVWTSRDGAAWSRVPHHEAVFGGEGYQLMFGVTAGGPGVVAVGADDSGGDAAVWTSVDGLIWTRIHHDEAVFGSAQMLDVAGVGHGLVAVGQGPGLDAAAWTSLDGITWSQVLDDASVFGGDGEHQMFSVAVGGPGLVAVGHEGSGSNFDAAVWVAATED